MGVNSPQEVLDLASENVIVKGFVSDDRWDETHKTCCWDVVPLKYRTGMKGKVIEDIYNPIPLLITSIGAGGLQNDDGVIAVEDEAQAFADRVFSLYQDEKELTKMKEASADYIQKYSNLNAVLENFKEEFVK